MTCCTGDPRAVPGPRLLEAKDENQVMPLQRREQKELFQSCLGQGLREEKVAASAKTN